MDGGAILTSFATGSVTVGAGGGAGTQIPAAGGLVGAALVVTGGTPTIGDLLRHRRRQRRRLIGCGWVHRPFARRNHDILRHRDGGTGGGVKRHVLDLAGGFAGEISGGSVSQSFSTGSVTVSAPSAEAEVGRFRRRNS